MTLYYAELSKCTSRLKAEKCSQYLGSRICGEKDSPACRSRIALLAPEIRIVLENHWNREKTPDWLAEGGEFELAIALRIGSQPPCSASEKITDWVARFAL